MIGAKAILCYINVFWKPVFKIYFQLQLIYTVTLPFICFQSLYLVYLEITNNIEGNLKLLV